MIRMVFAVTLCEFFVPQFLAANNAATAAELLHDKADGKEGQKEKSHFAALGDVSDTRTTARVLVQHGSKSISNHPLEGGRWETFQGIESDFRVRLLYF